MLNKAVRADQSRKYRRRIRFLPQMSQTECGAVCLAMVGRAWGKQTSVKSCREVLSIGRDGATAADLARGARTMGFKVRTFQATLEGLRKLTGTAILHWKFSHFVVLDKILSSGGAVIVDPASGRRRISADELSDSFTGVVVELSASLDSTSQLPSAKSNTWQFVSNMLRGQKRFLLQVLALSVGLQLVVLVPPLLTSFVVDTVLGIGLGDLLIWVIWAAILIIVTQLIFTLGRALVLSFIQARFDRSMMRSFFRHLLSLPYRYFAIRTSGDLTMRVASNAAIRDLLTTQVLSVFIDGLFVVLFIVGLLLFVPLYGVVALSLAAAQVLLLVLSFRWLKELTDRDVMSQAESQSYSVEALAGIETVKAMGVEGRVFDRWEHLLDHQVAAGYKRRQVEAFLDAILAVFRVAAPMAFLITGAVAVLDGSLTLGAALGVNALSSTLMTPLAAIVGSGRQLQMVKTQLDRLIDVLDETPERTNPEGDFTNGDIRLKNVSTGYRDGGDNVVHDICLDIPAGSSIALVGSTGSGKSTLAKTILGLYPPSSGEISYDGIPHDEVNQEMLRGSTGVVTQDTFLFAGSIAENVTIAKPDASVDELTWAVAQADLLEDVLRMPMGFETVLQEGGGGLSGGQKQRLAIARALIRKPKLMVLDEATSQLDANSEAKIDDVLQSLNCTRILIAHRLSTVRNADCIVVLDNGRVVETGTHQTLMQTNGNYSKLVRLQLSNDD